jgi:molecular chaperone GrpE (heat shock protein)
MMRMCVRVVICLCLLGSAASAEEKPNPDQLKKAYDDALVQLKAAQNSKNDLARENEKLARQTDDLKKQIAAAQEQIENLKRQVSDNDEKTFYLRSYQAAWKKFLKAHPNLLAEWRSFLGEDALAIPQGVQPPIDSDLPQVRSDLDADQG